MSLPKINPSTKETATLAIVQLTRFGDLLQTAQAISTLKKQYQNYRIILIAREEFARPLNFLLTPIVDKIVYLNSKGMFPMRGQGIKSFDDSKQILKSFLSELYIERIDVLINLSFSKSSNYLMSLIRATHKVGSHFGPDHALQIKDQWSQMIFSTVLSGNLNPFNLIDLFQNMIGNHGAQSAQNEQKKSIFSSIKKENNKQVIIHPFSSNEKKNWRADKWNEIIFRLLKDHPDANLYIVGSQSEREQAKKISTAPLLQMFHNRIFNLAGETNLSELLKLLKNASLLISHDSMVSHLASFAEIPILTISLGSVRPQETTPYSNNAYNIVPKTKCFPCFANQDCSYFQCHHDIPFHTVATVATELLAHQKIDSEWCKTNFSIFHSNSISFYKSNVDEEGQTLQNLIEQSNDTPSTFRIFYKILFSFFISQKELNLPYPMINSSTQKDLIYTLNGIARLFELYEFGKKYSLYILQEISSGTPNIATIKQFSAKIDEIDHLEIIIKNNYNYLAPIVDLIKIKKANLSGNNIVELTEQSYIAFDDGAKYLQVLNELVEKTLSEFKHLSGIKDKDKLNTPKEYTQI